MGLTADSTGRGAADHGLVIQKEQPEDGVFALAGNPNVGKSTVFNGLTGMNQHTGNWPGKTVANAQGRFERNGHGVILVDIPGTYSLMAHSEEEEVARDYICFGHPDGVVVVCDATCLERNLNLVLQTMELTGRVVLCVNLMDEARKKSIRVDCAALEQQLGIPVVAAAARQGEGLEELAAQLIEETKCAAPRHVTKYPAVLEEALDRIQPELERRAVRPVAARWAALRLLEDDNALIERLFDESGMRAEDRQALRLLAEDERSCMSRRGWPVQRIRDAIVSALVTDAERVAATCVTHENPHCQERDRRIDRILTGRFTGTAVMVLLLLFIFWLTITGANAVSDVLQGGLFWVGDRIYDGLHAIRLPEKLCELLVNGVWRVLAWVVSVMLPPMAIFFPLFTLLEDVGYLPRVAFNLDRTFRRAGTCGKQALTTCMGFGCNAAGVVGCRIIDSPRERLIAMVTNSFIPCNGRFPILIAMIGLFFSTRAGSLGASLILTALILFAFGMSLLSSKLLAGTVLRGEESSFTLELPPYRRPQIGKVLVRSIFDRTLFVLGRAAAVAAPAGLLIWMMANIYVGDLSLLRVCANALDPAARVIGLDGVILMAFILGFPANETVVPIMIMAYSSLGAIQSLGSAEMAALFTANGWTPLTALCVLIFTLMHWPCSTTCWTIRKESGSTRWTLLSILLPTVCGVVICFVLATAARLLGWA